MGASRDFRDGGDGTSNALSLGAYATWIHPQGWYVDIVGKYTHMWNHFSTRPWKVLSDSGLQYLDSWRLSGSGQTL
jgi:outer membrane autotransporter protein